MTEIKPKDISDGDVVLQIYSRMGHTDIIIAKFQRYYAEDGYVECTLIDKITRLEGTTYIMEPDDANTPMILTGHPSPTGPITEIVFFKLTEDETYNALMGIL